MQREEEVNVRYETVKYGIMVLLLHHPVLQVQIILSLAFLRLFGHPGACECSVVALVAVDENFVRHNNFNHVVAVVLAAQNFVLDFRNPKGIVLEIESRFLLGPIFNPVDLDLDRVSALTPLRGCARAAALAHLCPSGPNAS